LSIGAHQESQGKGQRGARPGDYALGASQSRAAARAMLARRFAGREKFDLIVSSPIPRPGGDGIRIGEWCEREDGTLTRVSFLPTGMTLAEAERIVAERGVLIPRP
jgi:hypothetical protein